jgi:hypothetical protein
MATQWQSSWSARSSPIARATSCAAVPATDRTG